MNVFIILLLTALGSLINIPIGQSGFRITLGIIAFIASVNYFNIKKTIRLSVLAGLIVCITRIVFDYFSKGMDLVLASNYLLETFFYLGYGFLYNYAILDNDSEYPLPLVVALVICDAGGNFLEYLLRHLATNEIYHNTSITSILLAAVTRSVIITLLVWIIEKVKRQRGTK